MTDAHHSSLSTRHSPEPLFFTVTDVKQMGYCPRLVYYHYCLPALSVAPTFHMQAGAVAGQKTEALEHRRSLRAYGLREAGPAVPAREFDVWLESERLGLRGRLDMLIVAEGELIPVDYKDSQDPGSGRGAGRQTQHNWQLQLAAYALLLEEARNAVITRGFIYYIPARRARPVALTPELKAEVRSLLAQMAELVAREWMPDPTPRRERCRACEYRRYCNDV